MVPRDTTSGHITRGSRSFRGALAGAGVALLVSAILLVLLFLRNPIIVDSVKLAMLLVLLPAAVAGTAIGAVVGALAPARLSGRLSSAWRFLLTSLVLALVVCIVGGVVSAAASRGPAEPGLKLLLVGIDGATWKVASGMMDRGELPNLSALVDAGASGVLTSSRPMYSTRIFTTVATGKVADKHGVRGLSDTSADDVLVKRIWEILHEQLEWDYGTVEWYLTWPPSTSPGGFAIPGMLAMTTETIPEGLSFVRELRDLGKIVKEQKLMRFADVAFRAATNGARLSTLAQLGSIAASRRSSTPLELYVRQQEALVRIVSDATRCQLRRTDVEMLAILYKSTDSVSHKYWRFHEPSAFPGIDPAAVEKHGAAVEDIYALVDEELGTLVQYLAPDGMLLAFSDHGFRASASLRAVPVSYKVETLLTELGFSLSDVTYINMGGSFYLQPLTLDDAESSRTLSGLDEVFSSLVIADSGAPAFFVERVDNEGTGDDFVLITTTDALVEASDVDPLIESSNGRSLHVSDFMTHMDISGTHAIDGIIVGAGGPFRVGESIEGATVYDITPTLLAALGLPVAEDMDGRVLTDAMDPSFLSRYPVTTVATYETEVRIQKRSDGVDSMSEETKDRLRSLGYMQ